MSDGRILNPFTGRKKRKARNKTKEKYMPEKKIQSLAENRQGIILQSRGLVRRVLRRLRCNLQWYRSSHRRCSVRKDVLKNFVNFTGKHLCWCLLLLKL